MFSLIRPLLFRLDPEHAHSLSLAALQLLDGRAYTAPPSALATKVAGLSFPSPIGLAAGYDKDAKAPDALLSLGFGSVEIGTITPKPQIGNPRPRLFRLVDDGAVINRMGFNNDGHAAAHLRLAYRQHSRRHYGAARGLVGVNIGANKDSSDRIADYVMGVRAMADVADYLTINISSPNTPGLRGLQDAGALDDLLAAISDNRQKGDPALFLKVAPDLDSTAIDDVAKTVAGRIDALIIGNTTVSRPALTSRDRDEAGGLSGAPLRALALEKLKAFRSATGGSLPLVAAGGIDSADAAWARIKAGASLVQLYSALVYHGPGLVQTISNGLIENMHREGFAQIADAVGVDAG